MNKIKQLIGLGVLAVIMAFTQPAKAIVCVTNTVITWNYLSSQSTNSSPMPSGEEQPVVTIVDGCHVTWQWPDSGCPDFADYVCEGAPANYTWVSRLWMPSGCGYDACAELKVGHIHVDFIDGTPADCDIVLPYGTFSAQFYFILDCTNKQVRAPICSSNASQGCNGQ